MGLKVKSSIVNDFLKQRDHYLHNAGHYLSTKDYRKASEFLWGALTQTIKAVAATKGIRIRSHIGFKEYMSDVSIELKDKSLWTDFIALQRLHNNFYDEQLSPADVQVLATLLKSYLDKLDSLIKKTIP